MSITSPASPPPLTGARRLGAHFLLVVVGAAVFVAYAVMNALPPSALSLPHARQLHQALVQVVPEGWAFFTRNPREATTVVFASGTGVPLVSKLAAPHAEARNSFGLDRTSRAQGAEIDNLVSQVNGGNWHRCTTWDRCAAPLPPVIVRNDFPRPTLCGRLRVVTQAPVPWAWSASAVSYEVPSFASELSVRC